MRVCRGVYCNNCEYLVVYWEILRIRSQIGSILSSCMYTYIYTVYICICMWWFFSYSVLPSLIDVLSLFQTKQVHNHQIQGYRCQVILFPTHRENLNLSFLVPLWDWVICHLGLSISGYSLLQHCVVMFWYSSKRCWIFESNGVFENMIIFSLLVLMFTFLRWNKCLDMKIGDNFLYSSERVPNAK